MLRLAILSTDRLPGFLGPDNPSEAGLFAEDDILIAAVRRRGVAARRVSWRQPAAGWSEFDAAVIRSTWDYIDDLEGFLSTLLRIERSGCRLYNPLATIRWNLDKTYLLELAEAGVEIVPTRLHVGGTAVRRPLGEAFEAPEGYIVKPTIGVGAFGTLRCADAQEVAEHLARAEAGERILIQPFLRSILDEGEWSFVFLGGHLAYSVLKQPRPGDFRVQVMYGAETLSREAAAADLAAAERAWAALPVAASYARIDMARLADGRLALMEAELIEPQLFFSTVPESAERFAECVITAMTPRAAGR